MDTFLVRLATFSIVFAIPLVAISHEGIPLPSDFLKHLSQRNPPYEIIPPTFLRPEIREMQNSPTYMTGDFNGDLRSDIAALVKETSSGALRLVVFLRNSQGFQEHQLYSFGTIDEPIDRLRIYIKREEPGVIQSFPDDTIPVEKRVAKLSYQSVHLVFVEKSSTLYYWEHGEFHQLITGD